jgi:hypothetical protein
MRTKVTLVLVFLNVALFFFIFKFERGWRTDAVALEARRRVLGAETADIQGLRITGPGLAPIALQRAGDSWSLTEPIEWPANPHAVNRIINELQFLEHETSFSVADLEKNKQSLADYGLAEPRLTLAFTTGSNEAPVTLEIGDETKVGNRLYILSPDRQRVHVVNLSLARSLNLPVEDLRADNVFSIPVFEARSLALQNPANLRVRIRRNGNRWAFEAPIIARASKTAVELTINALNSLRVQKFIPAGSTPENPAVYTGLRITLEGNNRRETLILGAEIGATAIATDAGAAPAQRADVEFNATLEGKATAFTVSVPAALVDALRNAQEILRETRILDFDAGNVTAVTLAAPNQPDLTLQQLETGAQGAGTWQVVRRSGQQSPQLLPAAAESVRQLIDTLRRLSAEKFVSDAPSDADLEAWGFNRPEREITLTFAAGGTTSTATLQIGLPTTRDGHAYARLGSARFVYQIDEALVARTAPDPLAYRQRLLRELPDTARFTALKITDLADNSVILDHPLDTPTAAEQTVLASLRRLEAKRLVRDGFPPTFFAGGIDRRWRWRIDATVMLPGGSGEQTETQSLMLTERVGGDLQYAGSPELGVVFNVNQDFLDALWQLTYGSKDPGADVATDPAAESTASAAPAPTPAAQP